MHRVDRIRSSRLRVPSLLLLALLLLVGCGGRKGPRSRPRLKEQVREVVKEKAPTAIVRVTKGTFQAADNQGRLVLVARITDADAILQPSDPSQGPVTLT